MQQRLSADTRKFAHHKRVVECCLVKTHLTESVPMAMNHLEPHSCVLNSEGINNIMQLVCRTPSRRHKM